MKITHFIQKYYCFLYSIIIRNGFLPASSKSLYGLNYRAKKLAKGRREGERGASGRSVKDVVGHSLKPSDQVKESKAAEGQNFLLSLPPLLGVHTMSFQESPFMCKTHSCFIYSHSYLHNFLHFTGKETDTHRGYITCSKLTNC